MEHTATQTTLHIGQQVTNFGFSCTFIGFHEFTGWPILRIADIS